MTQLYVLAAEYRDAAQQLAESDLDAQTVADTLDGMAGDLEAKAVSVAMVALNREAVADARDEAIKAMQARSKADRATAAHMRSYLLGAMQTTGISKVSCPYFTLSVRENPPAVDIFDLAQVPAEYMAPPPNPPASAPDKAKIKAAHKLGVEVPGTRLTQGQRLEIKP